jgi:hypothetical protein
MRDLLIRLARTRRFRARWTDEIQAEWVEAVLRDRKDLAREQLQRTVDLMNKAVPGASSVAGYEKLVEGLSLPDPSDRHVLAAAIRCGAAAIVTTNLKDFPKTSLAEFENVSIHPDDFIMDLADLEPQLLEITAKQQREGLLSPPLSADEFVETIERVGLPQTAAFLRDRTDLI